MSLLLYRNPRLLVLVIALICIAGVVAFNLLPRMEDPRLTPRAARVKTVFPGATAERVESLVTEKLEASIREVEEVKELRSVSSTSVSIITIELADQVQESEADNAWSRIREKMDDAQREFPSGVDEPEFSKIGNANSLILALKWQYEQPVNYAILHRLMEELKADIDRLPGTEKSELFGVPEEEVLVTLDPYAMTALGLSSVDISRAIAASDAKVSAGQLRTNRDNYLLEVAGEIDTLAQIGQIPIQVAGSGNLVELSHVATIEKSVKKPQENLALFDARPSVALGVQINPSTRIDRWSAEVDAVVEAYAQNLPAGIQVIKVFQQAEYVSRRMTSLVENLAYGVLAIFGVILLTMGWRAALVVGLALPLVSLIVLSLMHFMGIPIHQMSITGLIIAMGLMIDNAIVIVDEVASRLRKSASREQAIFESARFLAKPLAGSTLTTALSFSPIILMEGPSGEFVGAIALVAVLSVSTSFLLAITVIATLASLTLPASQKRGVLNQGLSSSHLAKYYGGVIELMLKNPGVGIVVGIALPIFGFVVAMELPEQFFPPAERSQFHIELELATTSSIAETEKRAAEIRNLLLEDPRVKNVQWFLGESALAFYYNVVPRRQNAPQYGQAIVDCVEGTDVLALLREKQELMDSRFPSITVLLRQLEQGPPFDAPIEIRISGPSLQVLRALGDQVRLVLAQTENVHHTRSGLAAALPKVSFVVDEQQARLAGLDHRAIAMELSRSLEGITGGSLVEATEELPIRVRVAGQSRSDLAAIASMDLLARADASNAKTRVSYRGVPLSAISHQQLVSETANIRHLDGKRINEVQGYIKAGVLPSAVLSEFERRLAAANVRLPTGYKIEYGGADSKRNDAVRELVGNVFIIVALMISTMVISVQSFRLAIVLFAVAGLSMGLGFGGLWLFGFPRSFMSLVATMGMIGVAVNDSIVVLAAIMELPRENATIEKVRERVVESTRHILSTTLTTVVGFAPLFLYGGDLWRPVAVTISCGVGGATLLALVFVPCCYVLLRGVRVAALTSQEESTPQTSGLVSA